ncbi:MAG: hypothetical protein ACJ749_04205 [Flavisolibacter sp.]
MNHLLVFTGDLLYFVLSIILLPLFMLVQLLLWTVPAAKFIKANSRKLFKIRIRRTYHLPHFLDLIFERAVKKHI